MTKKQGFLSKALCEITGYKGAKKTAQELTGIKSKAQVTKGLTGDTTVKGAIAKVLGVKK